MEDCSLGITRSTSFIPDVNLLSKVRYMNKCMGKKINSQQLNTNLTLPSLPGLWELARFGDGETLRDRGESFPLVCFSGVGLLRGGGLL
jgi:hypothetical protein